MKLTDMELRARPSPSSFDIYAFVINMEDQNKPSRIQRPRPGPFNNRNRKVGLGSVHNPIFSPMRVGLRLSHPKRSATC